MSLISSKIDIYGGKSPLEMPVYPLAEVARYLHVPAATIRTWTLGRSYPFLNGERTSAPLIKIADKATPALSFLNVVELHVLSAIRRKHKVEMPSIRRALDYLGKRFQIKHPLADQQMMTDGTCLFIEKYGNLVNISRDGQTEMREVVQVYLSRIDRDTSGLPIRLYPFSRPQIENAPRSIAMNPRVHFGLPCLTGTGIPTSIIADRHSAGDNIAALAKDYGQTPDAIEEAIRFEFRQRAA